MLSILIKPASSRCNLKCKYCFYEDESLNRSQSDYGMMKVETLEVIIKKALEYEVDVCSFLFQGGEPTLVGLHFYEHVIKFQQRYNVHHVKIMNSIQSNGLLLDESWAHFFKQHDFLVGLSIDGIKVTHECYRGKNFDQVVKAAELLKRFEVPFNVLTVVTDEVCEQIAAIYTFYKQHHFRCLQFIPCLDSLDNHNYLSVDSYTTFLKTLFQLWFDDATKGNLISIGYFDDLLHLLCAEFPKTCGRLGRCGMHYVLEADGSVYPCDFYMMDAYYLGNLLQDDFEVLNDKRRDLQFLEPIFSKTCKKCKWYRLCYGGCRRERVSQLGVNKYCQAYQAFLEEAYPLLQWMANRILMTNI